MKGKTPIQPSMLRVCLQSVDWTSGLDWMVDCMDGGLDWWTGLVDWTGGLDWWTRLVDWTGWWTGLVDWMVD